MTETMLITVLCGIVAGLFSLLTALLGWGGSKIISRLDDVVDKLGEVAGELHERINGIDRRLTRVETKVEGS